MNFSLPIRNKFSAEWKLEERNPKWYFTIELKPEIDYERFYFDPQIEWNEWVLVEWKTFNASLITSSFIRVLGEKMELKHSYIISAGIRL